MGARLATAVAVVRVVVAAVVRTEMQAITIAAQLATRIHHSVSLFKKKKYLKMRVCVCVCKLILICLKIQIKIENADQTKRTKSTRVIRQINNCPFDLKTLAENIRKKFVLRLVCVCVCMCEEADNPE